MLMRRYVETKIARVLIKDALLAGYEVSVNNGGDKHEISRSTDAEVILAAMFAADEDLLFMRKDGKEVGWVRFVYGNDGWDVIADYTCSLEHIMAGANAESARWD